MTDTKALREVLGASPLDKEPKAVETVESGNESTGVENLPQVRSESQDEDGETTVYLRGLRFAMVSLLIGILVFLVSAEATIVVTVLVAITKDFGEFTSVSWIMSSFQLGFVATIVVSAKLSDLFGRKTVLMTMIALFTAFSAGCALAQTITQLSVFELSPFATFKLLNFFFPTVLSCAVCRAWEPAAATLYAQLSSSKSGRPKSMANTQQMQALQ
jgi:MFS family permease